MMMIGLPLRGTSLRPTAWSLTGRGVRACGTLRLMPDANEEIVRRYLELHGYFVRSRVRYKYTTPHGGSGWSDIDLCGITTDRRAIAVEVKGWHTEKFTGSYRKNWPALFHFAERP